MIQQVSKHYFNDTNCIYFKSNDNDILCLIIYLFIIELFLLSGLTYLHGKAASNYLPRISKYNSKESGDESGDESDDKSEEESGDKSEEETGDESGDKSEEETGDESGDKSEEETGDESGDESEEKTSEKDSKEEGYTTLQNKYENTSIKCSNLSRSLHYIVEVNGINFKKHLGKYENPFDEKVFSAMDETCTKLVKDYKPLFGYTVSDKIYLLFDKGKINNNFNKDSRLFCSKIASLVTFEFNVTMEDLTGMFLFDCKAFNIDDSKVVDYFRYHCYYKNKKNILSNICQEMGVIEDSKQDLDDLEKLVNNDNITMVANLPDDYVYGCFFTEENNKIARKQIKLDVFGELVRLQNLIKARK